MPSPLDHVDAASFFGSWPLTPYFSGSTPGVLPGALLDRATLLSARRESDAGFNVSGRSFKIWIDAVGPITVTFTGTNPLDLDTVITQINSGVLGGYGQDVAFRDNGFLRLRSATIGSTSYLKVDTDPASSPADVFFELGLFAGAESDGGKLTSSPTVDPDRQVALPGQYSVSYGDDLDYNAINRAICQLAVNADHAYGQFRRGMAKTTSKDLAISSDEVQITGENVYCGKITGGSAQDDTAVVLDTSDNEVVVERDTDTHTSLALDFYYNVEEQKQYVEATAATPFTAGDAAGDYYVVVTPGGSFGALEKMKIIEFVSTSIVVVANIVEADGSEVEVGTPSSPVSITTGIRRRTDTERLYITDFLDGPAGSSVIDTAVEIVAATTISRVEWNNRLVCGTATFSAAGVKEGDVAVIASHDTSVPFSNNGSYRVSKVIDEKTIELMGLDHGPVILNTLGSLGTVTIQTDTNFFYQPYAKLNFAPSSGTYRIVFKKYASLLEMVDDVDSFATSPTRFVQETSTDIQKVVKAIIGPSATTFNEYLYNDKRNSLENLYFRLNQEHNADGHHPYLYITDTMPEATWIGTKLTVQHDFIDPTGDALGTGTVNADVISLVENKNAWAFEARVWSRDPAGTYNSTWLGALWGEGKLSGNARATSVDAHSGGVYTYGTSDITGWASVFRVYAGSVNDTSHIENYAGLRVDDISGVGADQSYGVWIEGAGTAAIQVESGKVRLWDDANGAAASGWTGNHTEAICDTAATGNYYGHLFEVDVYNRTGGGDVGNIIAHTSSYAEAGTYNWNPVVWAAYETHAASAGATINSVECFGGQVNHYGEEDLTWAVVFRAYGGPAPTGGGNFDNYAGLYVDNITRATDNYGVYVKGASTAAMYAASGRSFFVDATTIAGTTFASSWNPRKIGAEWAPGTATASGNAVVGLTTLDGVSGAIYLGGLGGGVGLKSTVTSGTVNGASGVYGQVDTYHTSGCTFTSAAGLEGWVANRSTGTIGSAYGLFIWEASNYGTGSIIDNYGIYVRNQTAGDDNYGVYIAGASTAALYIVGGDTVLGPGLMTHRDSGTFTGWDAEQGWKSISQSTHTATADNYAYLLETRLTSTDATHNFGGLIVSHCCTHSANATNWTPGVWSEVVLLPGASGNINQAEAFGAAVYNRGSGTIGSGAGLRVYDGLNDGGGTFTNQYGVRIENLTAAANNYGVYVAGASTYGLWVETGTVRFDDLVQIGDGTAEIVLGAAGGFANTMGFSRPGNNYINAYDAAGSLHLGAGGANSRLVVRGDGDITIAQALGLGITPTTALHLARSAGDCGILIEADTDNDNEEDNPYVKWTQDGGVTAMIMGLIGQNNDSEGTAITGGLQNSFYCGTKSTTATPIQFGISEVVAMTIATTRRVGIGTSSPDMLFHVRNSDTGGSWPANTYIGLENNDDCFFTIMAADAKYAGVLFADSASTQAGRVRYHGTNNNMELWTAGAQAVNIASNGWVGIGPGFTAADSRLHVWGSNSGQDPISGTMLTVELGNNCYISVLTPSDKAGGLVCGDAADSDAGFFTYRHDHTLPGWTLGTESNIVAKFDSEKRLYVGYADDWPTQFDGSSPHINRQLLNIMGETTSGAAGIFFGSGWGAWQVYTGSGDSSMHWDEGGVQKMILTEDGDLTTTGDITARNYISTLTGQIITASFYSANVLLTDGSGPVSYCNPDYNGGYLEFRDASGGSSARMSLHMPYSGTITAARVLVWGSTSHSFYIDIYKKDHTSGISTNGTIVATQFVSSQNLQASGGGGVWITLSVSSGSFDADDFLWVSVDNVNTDTNLRLGQLELTVSPGNVTMTKP